MQRLSRVSMGPRLRVDDVYVARMAFISHYEIEYHILKIEHSAGRIDTLLSRDSLFATKRP